MDMNKFSVENYHCVSKRVPVANSYLNLEDIYVETVGSKLLKHEQFKDFKGYSRPLSIINSHHSEDFQKEYSIEIAEGYEFFVRELYCKYNNSYWYETYLQENISIKDYREEELFSLESILFNVTVEDLRVTDNGYHDGECLNQRLAKEDLFAIYEKAFGKNVFEMIVMCNLSTFKSVYVMGQEDIKDKFKNLMGISKW